MFSSACSRRSAQCAALIALATVAGMARFEPSSSSQPDTRPGTPSVSLTPSHPRPPLHPCVLLAHVLRLYRDAFFTSVLARTTPDERPTPAAAGGADPAPRGSAALAAALRPFAPATDVPPLSARLHVIPFAVGPPAQPATPPRRADATSVRHDVSARCPCVPSVVIVRPFPVARLARRRFSGPPGAARPFRPSSALRGEPAPLPAPVRFLPALDASARRAPHPCHFFA